MAFNYWWLNRFDLFLGLELIFCSNSIYHFQTRGYVYVMENIRTFFCFIDKMDHKKLLCNYFKEYFGYLTILKKISNFKYSFCFHFMKNSYFIHWNFDENIVVLWYIFTSETSKKDPQFNFSSQNLSIERNFLNEMEKEARCNKYFSIKFGKNKTYIKGYFLFF